MVSTPAALAGEQERYIPWFKTPGGWAYCTQPDGIGVRTGFLCFSTVTGLWIKVSERGVTSGRDSKYVHFQRRGTQTITDVWADDRPGEAWAICRVAQRFMRCSIANRPNAVFFWMKQSGPSRILR